jgi:hypothetical protein
MQSQRPVPQSQIFGKGMITRVTSANVSCGSCGK